MAYTPTQFTKNGVTRTAYSMADQVKYIFAGWTAVTALQGDTGTPVQENAYENLIASSRDHAATTVALSIGSYGYLAPCISVPPQTGPVALFYGMPSVICTVAGTGIIGCGVADTTDGTLKLQAMASRGGTFALGTFAPLLGSVEGTFELDPSPNWRHYRLVGFVFRDSGSLAASQGGSAAAGAPAYQPDDRPAYLRAVRL